MRRTVPRFVPSSSSVSRPLYSKWEKQGEPDVEMLRELVKEGYYLRLSIPKQFGGLGIRDWKYHAIVTEELEQSDVGSFFLNLGNDVSKIEARTEQGRAGRTAKQSSSSEAEEGRANFALSSAVACALLRLFQMVLSYFTKSATPEQQARWLPRIAKEGLVIAIAMSEPELGSDLATLRTRATRSADGQSWSLTGRKMWISAGIQPSGDHFRHPPIPPPRAAEEASPSS